MKINNFHLPVKNNKKLFRRSAVSLSLLMSLSCLAYEAEAACSESFPGSGGYTCIGAGSVSQTIIGDNLSISISDDFSFEQNANSGLEISASGGVKVEQAVGGPSLITNGTALYVEKTGSGSVEVDINSFISGIYIDSTDDNENISIRVKNDVDGSIDGIASYNRGSGTTLINIDGNVIGQNGRGVIASNYGSDIRVDVTGNVNAFYSGVEVENQGSGKSDIYVGGNIVSQGMGWADGIHAINGVSSTDLTILVDGSITVPNGDASYSNGIYAQNSGTGNTDITVKGKVTGGNSLSNAQGIFVRHGGNDLTINALGGVSGGYAGIKAQNEGTGLTLINTAGEINSGLTGIDVQNDSRATGLTVRSSSDIQAGMVGIKAINWGSGATDIFSAGAIESDDDGIYLDHRGADLRLVAQGSITSEQANGISVVSYAQSDARLSITATSQVYGEEDGIFVIGGGNDGVVNITASDSVTGQNGTGIYIYSNLLDATVDIASTVKGGNGTAIDMENAGKSATLVLRHGWALEGQAIATQEGNDTLRLAGLANGSLSLAQIGNDADANAIMGFERVEKVDSSIWTLTGNQQFGGFESAALSGGGLVLDNASFLLAGAASTFDIERGTTLYVKGASSIDGALSSRGTIDLNTTGTPDNTLTVTGDFTSSDSLLRFGTQLGADGSPTSLLVVEGNTFGQGRVQVDNLGGLGAQTIEGIKLIHVEQDSNATFEKNSRIVAGSYDYDLVKKGGNWYLTSVYQEPTPEPETEIEPKPEEGKHVYRPEAGSYLANYMASNTLFITRLHDRLGETQYTDVLTGEKKVTSLWMRHVGGHNRFRDGSGQLHTQSNRYVLQLGGDLAQWSTSGLDRWHLGAMAGYANQRSNTEAKYSKYRSRGSVEGYSAGLYGTWYANDREKTGSYVDAWALYNWFDSDVKGEELKSESYSSRGVTASVEGGYTIKLGERLSDGVVYYLQPKAQVVWMNVRTKDHTESNGTRIAFRGDGNIQTRLGLRAYMNGRADSDKNTDRKFQPFVEANWLHNTNDFSLRMDDVNNRVAGAKNLAELKLGVEGQISKELDIWTNVAQQLGDQGYSDTQAMMGIKYRF